VNRVPPSGRRAAPPVRRGQATEAFSTMLPILAIDNGLLNIGVLVLVLAVAIGAITAGSRR